MITARRLRENAERERQGIAPRGPAPPTSIAFTVHQQEVAKLNMAHARELSALRKELGGDGDKALREENAQLKARVKELEADVAQKSKDVDELLAGSSVKAEAKGTKKGSSRSQG